MGQTVGSYQIAASFINPANGQSPIDADQVRLNDNTLQTAFNQHDADPAIHLQSGLIAARPAFGAQGRKWLSTDELKIYLDTGLAWLEVAYLPLIGGTVTGAVTFNANVTVNADLGITGTGVLVVGTDPGGAERLRAQSLRVGGVAFLTDGVTTAKIGPSGGAMLVGTDTAHALQFVTNGGVRWAVSTAGDLTPVGDNATDIGSVAARLRRLYLGTALTVGASAGNGTGAQVMIDGGLPVGLANAANIVARNVAGSANVSLIAADASDRVVLGGTNAQGVRLLVGAAGFEVSSTGHLVPAASDTYTLGTNALRVHTVYTQRLGISGVVYTLPAADGSANQVLSTSGTGVLSWATVTGGGGGSNDLFYRTVLR